MFLWRTCDTDAKPVSDTLAAEAQDRTYSHTANDLGERLASGDITQEEYDAAWDEAWDSGEIEEKFSIGKTTENKTFVEIDEDILSGIPEEKWVSVVKNNLKQKFPYGVTVGNGKILIDEQSRKELTYSRYMHWLYNNDKQLHINKLRATNNADEILRATTEWINEGLNHPRNDKIIDFARGNVLMRVGENDYTAEVVVGTRNNGSMVLYDVLNLMPTSFNKKETATAISENPSPRAARNTATISDDSISQASGDVKGEYSISDSDGRLHLYDITNKLRDSAHRINDVERSAQNNNSGRDGALETESLNQYYYTKNDTESQEVSRNNIDGDIQYSLSDPAQQKKVMNDLRNILAKGNDPRELRAYVRGMTEPCCASGERRSGRGYRADGAPAGHER